MASTQGETRQTPFKTENEPSVKFRALEPKPKLRGEIADRNAVARGLCQDKFSEEFGPISKGLLNSQNQAVPSDEMIGSKALNVT